MSFIDHIPQSEASYVQVAVRVRPMNKREKDTKVITEVTADFIYLNHPTKPKKKFFYDLMYDVTTEQKQLYSDIGSCVINNAFQGYNSCVFAYGLTGCFAKGTSIMMINGSYKAVENVSMNDVLMGDDSTPRNIVKLFKGRQNMYRIKPKLAGYGEYIVNEDHIMVFEVNTTANIRWVITRNHWVVMQYNPDDNMMRSKSFTPVILSDEYIAIAEQDAIKYMKTLDQTPKIIEMSVKDYINDLYVKKYYLNCITTSIEFPEQSVLIPPYSLGLWLGNDSKYSKKITLINDPNVNIIESSLDVKKNPTNPLFYKYNLLNIKHIPKEYLQNSRKVRIAVLAGLIDSDIFYDKKKGNFEIIQKIKSLATDIIYLCRSLGYYASMTTCKQDCLYHGDICSGTHYICLINSINLSDMPVFLVRKLTNYYSKNNNKCNKYLRWRPVVESLGVGNYYGFMLDGNHRFIGAGFNVLRNSGKTFSMMGNHDKPGLIPRICQSLFTEQESHAKVDKGNYHVSYRVELSYLEIYSERVIDLMDIDNKDLNVRQHPDYGPYVENLTQLLVEDYRTIKHVIDKGNKNRHVASTLMNNRSSRSHAIITIYFTQIVVDGNINREVVSKINLVDLAGSERVDASGVTGVNFTEAIEINKSLSTLGLVISKLAESANNATKSKDKKLTTSSLRHVKKGKVFTPCHIPFRDSVLTWILKESLGGNSKTYMIATISPSEVNYNETLSTLRYASNAKQIVNTVKINEDPNDKIIRVLRDEIILLRKKLINKRESVVVSSPEIRHLSDEIKQREDLMKEKEKTWTSKLEESRVISQIAEKLHKEELAVKQEEYKCKLEHMDHERSTLLFEMESLKSSMSDQELVQQQVIDQELIKAQGEFAKQRDEFEKTKIVETAVSLQEYYEKRINEVRIEYETKQSFSDEFVQLTKDNLNLKNQLAQNQKDLQFQMRRFTNERVVLSKQIKQLTAKIRSLESNLKDTSQHEQAYNSIKAKRDSEEQKFNILQYNFERLTNRINSDQKTLDDLNVKHSLIVDEINHSSEHLLQLKKDYNNLQNKFDINKAAYEELLKIKNTLHQDIDGLRVIFNQFIVDAGGHIKAPNVENLQQIQAGLDSILHNLNKCSGISS
jgi:hypothetical protein